MAACGLERETKASFTSDLVLNLFEDREGNVWVATPDGLDRFREYAVPTISENQGLSSGVVNSVLASKDGSVWLGTNGGGLDRINQGEITIYRSRNARTQGSGQGMTGNVKRGQRLSGFGAASQPSTVREITGSGLPYDSLSSILQDDEGRIWISTRLGIAYLENGRFVPVGGVPAVFVSSIVKDRAGNLWIAEKTQGLFHLFQTKVVEQIPWAKLGRKDSVEVMFADPTEAGLWIGFYSGGVLYFKDDQVRKSYSPANGVGEGRVDDLHLDGDGTLWAATEGGLSRVKNGHIETLSSKNGLPCDIVHWAIQDDAQSFWLYTPCGLVRIARPEMDAWVADPRRTVQFTVFGSSDGVRSLSVPTGYSPRVAKTADGKLWFLPLDGVSVIDPLHLPINKIPPPVHVEQITADRKTYWENWYGDAASLKPKLPPLVRDPTIDYTALSLVVAEKVQFRYKLEGWDRDWQDAGTRRQAFYSNLAPRKYRFRVMACNNSGVWNEAGDTLDFSIAPAYWQTNWFRAACVAAFLVLLWMLYRMRLRQVAQQFNMRMEERVNERTRIARDLHDTLLQSFHGLLLRFQAATNLLPERPEEAKRNFESAIDYAAQAITEGRDAVQGLRSSTVVKNDLAVAINTLGEELAGAETNPNGAKFHVGVEGTARELHPILRDEVYRIAGEAMRNAFKHAKAGRIEVEMRYDERELRLRVRDDGKGVDPEFIKKEGREGHFGLHGMRERAGLLGGKLTVWSELEAGTEVELRIPGANAYEKGGGRRRSWLGKGLAEKLAGKGTGTEREG